MPALAMAISNARSMPPSSLQSQFLCLAAGPYTPWAIWVSSSFSIPLLLHNGLGRGVIPDDVHLHHGLFTGVQGRPIMPKSAYSLVFRHQNLSQLIVSLYIGHGPKMPIEPVKGGSATGIQRCRDVVSTQAAISHRDDDRFFLFSVR